VNFPVLISGTYSYLANAPTGKLQNANGYDLIFATDPVGSQRLDHEIESYGPADGKINMWVRIPTLSHTSDTTIYMFYGNSSITSSQENRNGVWDPNYEAVWACEKRTTLDATDSTANSNNGTDHGATATSGQIDGAASFSAAGSQYIDAGDTTSLQMTGPMTVETWIDITGDGINFPRFLGKVSLTVVVGFFTSKRPGTIE